MKTSSQLLIVRIATAASALLLASVPFVVTLSVLSMLLLIPSLMMIALFLGAVAEHCGYQSLFCSPNKAAYYVN